MPYFWFTVICLIWGSSFILMKRAMICLSPLQIGGGRALGGALALAILFALLNQRWHLRWRDLWVLALVVLLGFAWPHSLQPELVAQHGGAFVGMSVGFTPLFTIMVSIPILKIWPTQRQIVGVIGALASMILLLFDLRRHSIPMIDVLMAFSVPFGYSIANSLIRRNLKHLPPLELTLLCLVASSSILLPMSAMVGNPRPTDPEQLSIAILAVAVLGIVGTGFATFLFNRLVQEQGPLFASMTTNLIPVGAVVWGMADGEQVSSVQIIALAGILAMVTYVQFGSAKVNDLEYSVTE